MSTTTVVVESHPDRVSVECPTCRTGWDFEGLEAAERCRAEHQAAHADPSSDYYDG